ncbi:hypothetical protein AcV7_004403 [Taiwanofungus camphoratus]|nr:hypothetical protein AcV7_004403 [Antrodia cinnamomea]
MAVTFTTVEAGMVSCLRDAVRDCADRGLSAASKWASELLLSLPSSKRQLPQPGQHTGFHTSTPTRSRSPHPPKLFDDHTPAPGSSGSLSTIPSTQPRHPHAPPLQSQLEDVHRRELEWEAQDADFLATARALFEAKEFIRAVHWLDSCKSSKARFLNVYSQYLASEKQALRNWYKVDNTRYQPPMPVNTSLIDLLEIVKNATDPWLLFLKALFLHRLSRREEAIESALLSIARYPWNWATWSVLGECLGDGEELSSLLPLLPLPPTHPLVLMFQVKTMNSLNSPSENELGLCDRLLNENVFPRSLWIMSLRACVLYHLHDFKQAQIQGASHVIQARTRLYGY